jgi:hypothetical protein
LLSLLESSEEGIANAIWASVSSSLFASFMASGLLRCALSRSLPRTARPHAGESLRSGASC